MTHNVAEAVYLADRVIVMTPHPGLVKAQVAITLPRPRDPLSTKTIRLLIGFGAGGPTDIPARFVADKLSERLGQRVVVENKPAAAGMIATRDVLSQPRDGYTLLLCTHFEAINTAVYKNPLFSLADVAPISLIAEYYYGLALSLSIPAHDIRSIVQYSNAQPGDVSYATIGVSSARIWRGSSKSSPASP